MNKPISQAQVLNLVQKIKHYLITNVGKVASQASIEEFYKALIIALREEIMINWTATKQTIQQARARTVHYLSMEYLPGRYLQNNLTNIDGIDLIKQVLQIMNRNYSEIIACEPDQGLGNGGLGRLSSCFMDSLATLQYPAYGYGLRYQYGIFEQELWDGVQVERPDCWLLNEDPWSFRRDTHSVSVLFQGNPIAATNSHGDPADLLEDYEEVRALPFDTPIIGYSNQENFSVLTLRLWSTKESPRNFQLQRYNAGQLDEAGENTSLTDVLYPNDHHETGKRIRLKQEYLLVAASLQDIIARHIRIYGDLTNFSDKVRIQINDTHPAMIISELVRRLMANHDQSWGEAWQITQEVCSYTNHTILREALEEWNEQRLSYLLPRQYRILQILNQEFCQKVRERFPNDEARIQRMSILHDGQAKMAFLSIYGSHKVNGVAHLHGEILKNYIFKDFHEMYPDKICSITNGVTQRRWLLNCNPLLAGFITERIGNGWINDFRKIKKLAEFASDPESQKAFLEVKKQNKKRLNEFLGKENPIRDPKGKIIDHSHTLDENALLDVQIKRIHEYKRPLLNALHLIMLYFELLENPQARKCKRMVVIGGKAAPGYAAAKQIIRLFHCIARKCNQEKKVGEHLRVAFIENYNISKAEIIIPAADLSQQISTAGMEASGTGNMKLSMNGALTLATEDGANIEMHQEIKDQWWPFSFGSSAHELAEIRAKSSYNPWDIYVGDPHIHRAVDALKDSTFAENDSEHEDFCHLRERLLKGHYGEQADSYFILKDLPNYYQVQQKVEEFYATPDRWAEFAIHNIAGMGKFSSDNAIVEYAEKIWRISPCPPTAGILNKVCDEYSENAMYKEVIS